MKNITRKTFLKSEIILPLHCYHQTVKEYKSNGSLIRSKTDYYQAIGG